jgi:hypothetical protein
MKGLQLLFEEIWENGKKIGISFCPNHDILPSHEEINSIVGRMQQLKNKMTDKEIKEHNKKIEKKLYDLEEEQLFGTENIEKERNIKEGYVYIIKASKYFKIGRALNHGQRIKRYIVENPDEIEVILCEKVKDYIKVEKDLHWIVSHKNHNREWFNLDDKDLNTLKSYIEGKKI